MIVLDPNRACKYRAYVARPITGLDESDLQVVDSLTKSIRQACDRNEIEPYDPDSVTGTRVAPGMSATEVYGRDLARVASSDVIFAIATPKSVGVGIEYKLASEFGIPVVLVVNEALHEPLSRMLTGSSTRVIATLRFRDFLDFDKKLEDSMSVVLNNLDIVGPRKVLVEARDLPLRIKRRRMDLKLDEAEFARQLGIADEGVKELEGVGFCRSHKDLALPPEYQSNPSLVILMKVADVLQVPFAWLLTGFDPKKSSEVKFAVSDTAAKSIEHLFKLVAAGKARPKESQELMTEYIEELGEEEGLLTADVVGNRAVPVVDEAEWLKRLRTHRGDGTLFGPAAG